MEIIEHQGSNDHSPSEQTKENSKVPQDFLIKYGLSSNPNDLQPHHVNSFRTIAIADPFPNDYQSLFGSLEESRILIDKIIREKPSVIEG